MKAIVRKDTGDDWEEYLRKLAAAEGLENRTDDHLRRMDRKRTDKKVSNKDWESPSDPNIRVAKMKDGRTHLAYKAEHAVDLETEAIVASKVTPADQGDTPTGPKTLGTAQANIQKNGSAVAVTDCVADKGYNDTALIAEMTGQRIRTYIPERRQKLRQWTDKPAGDEKGFRGNRRPVAGERGRRLSRSRSERFERTFARVCEIGGERRAWVRGAEEVSKLHQMRCPAYNLGLVLRKVFGLWKPRVFCPGGGSFVGVLVVLSAGVVPVTAVAGRSIFGIWTVVLLFVVVLRIAHPGDPTCGDEETGVL